MAYNIQVPEKLNIKQKIVFEKSGFKVLYYYGHYIAAKDDYKLGEICPNVLKTKFRDDFWKWLEFLKDKDKTKVERIRGLLKQAEDDCQLIEKIWE